ncbi:MAG: cupin domain-containing protein [Cyanobacteriota bacterium]|nr:cupin domain-containing protein [Cyanobacteriota bacterium]
MPEGSRAGTHALVQALRLEPHPEGGWYREEHRGAITVRRSGDGAERSALTLIWFLLTAPEISRWHRVLGADETWHHAGGDPLELWLLPPEGGVAERQLLGPLAAPLPPAAESPPAATGDTALPARVVPAGWWQAARCRGAWSLVTCCVGPGFDFQDFQLLHQWPVADHPPGALRELL